MKKMLIMIASLMMALPIMAQYGRPSRMNISHDYFDTSHTERSLPPLASISDKTRSAAPSRVALFCWICD